MGLSGCFLSIVQKLWNKACTSIIKCASHGSEGCIKASCSESMRFCKNNFHILNVINTFFSSVPLTVIRANCSDRFKVGRMFYLRGARDRYILVSQVCLQEQRKHRFFTLSKENQSPLGLYWNHPSFSFTNPRFVFLIRDQSFVLFSLCIRH